METDIDEASIDLPQGSCLRIDDGIGLLLRVREGELWLTQEGSLRDHLVSAGRALRIDRAGLAIASALRPSRVDLVPATPARPPRVRLVPAVSGRSGR